MRLVEGEAWGLPDLVYSNPSRLSMLSVLSIQQHMLVVNAAVLVLFHYRCQLLDLVLQRHILHPELPVILLQLPYLSTQLLAFLLQLIPYLHCRVHQFLCGIGLILGPRARRDRDNQTQYARNQRDFSNDVRLHVYPSMQLAWIYMLQKQVRLS